MNQTMLTRETRSAISLLKEISHSPGLLCPDASLPEPLQRFQSDILSCLCRAELLHADSDRKESVRCSYSLVRPLHEISLYEVLRALHDSIRLPLDTADEYYGDYGISGRQLAVLGHTARYFLSQIRLAELFFPEDTSAVNV